MDNDCARFQPQSKETKLPISNLGNWPFGDMEKRVCLLFCKVTFDKQC
jgi:hypothetical protein